MSHTESLYYFLFTLFVVFIVIHSVVIIILVQVWHNHNQVSAMQEQRGLQNLFLNNSEFRLILKPRRCCIQLLGLLLVGILNGENSQHFDDDMHGCLSCILLHSCRSISVQHISQNIAVIVTWDFAYKDGITEHDLQVVCHLHCLQLGILHRNEAGLSSAGRIQRSERYIIIIRFFHLTIIFTVCLLEME